jgi:hypothetical protein
MSVTRHHDRSEPLPVDHVCDEHLQVSFLSIGKGMILAAKLAKMERTELARIVADAMAARARRFELRLAAVQRPCERLRTGLQGLLEQLSRLHHELDKLAHRLEV